MKTLIFQALRLTSILALFFGVLYTMLIFGIAQLIPGKGKGKITEGHYSAIGQKIDSDAYFNSRPSAVDYNAAGSGGSNKGTTNPEYLALVQARIDTFQVHNPKIKRNEIPSDLVTASGSGLDSHISVEAARVQVPRIAVIRKISEEKLYKLVQKNTESPLLGLFGPVKISVIKLNLELNKISKL